MESPDYRAVDSLKRKRGRPRRDEGKVDDAIKVRREKNREAQRMLKARKLAEHAEMGTRIEKLEQTIGVMSDTLLTLADGIMTSSIARQDRYLTQRLRDSISHTLLLVSGSIDPALQRDQIEDPTFPPVSTSSNQKSSSSPLASTSAQLTATAASPNVDTSALDLLVGDFEQSEAVPNASPEPPFDRNPYGFQYTWNPSMAPNSFGSDFVTDFPPAVSPSKALDAEDTLKEHASLQLVHSTLIFAYHALRNSMDVSTGLAARIFGYSLQVYSREQLLSKLIWSLGPGLSDMPGLVQINMDGEQSRPSHSTSPAQESFGLAASTKRPVSRVSHPGIDEPLIDASGIIAFLLAMRARRIDGDTWELAVGGSANSPETPTAQGYLQNRHSFLNKDVLFPTNDLTQSMQWDYSRTSLRTSSVWISQSALFQRLSEVSVCMRSGVAYRRQPLEEIILASRIAPP